MKKIIWIVVLIALAGGSFGAAYFVSKTMHKESPVAADPNAPSSRPSELADLPHGAAVSTASEAQLDDLAHQLRAKLSQLDAREAKLQSEAKRLEAAEAQLKQSAAELETLQGRLMETLTKIKAAQAELSSSRVVVTQQEKANLKRIAAWYEKMDSVEAGKALESMCSDKLEDDAVRILAVMNERAAANLLAEIQDKKLVAKLTEKMKRLKEEV